MTKNYNTKYISLLFLVTVVWGSTFFIVKNTVANLDEYIIVAIRNTLAALFFFVYVFLKNKKVIFNRNNIIKGAFLGFYLAMVYITQVIGLKYTTTGHSAFITGIAIILVPLIMFLFYKERFRLLETASFLIVTMGLYLLTYSGDAPLNIGDLITLLSALSAAIHIILAGKYVKKYDVNGLILYQFIFAALFSYAGYFLFSNSTVSFTQQNIISLLYLGLIGTLFCFFVSVWVQKYVSTITVVLMFSLEPVFACFFGYYFLNETLNLFEISGALIILTGIFLYHYLKEKGKTA